MARSNLALGIEQETPGHVSCPRRRRNQGVWGPCGSTFDLGELAIGGLASSPIRQQPQVLTIFAEEAQHGLPYRRSASGRRACTAPSGRKKFDQVVEVVWR